MANRTEALRYREEEERAALEVPSSPCLSDDDIVGFVEGRLDDAEMRRVHVHADRCGLCQELLSHAAHALGPGVDGDEEARAFGTMLRPREVLRHRYRIVRFLASGGMGEVYEAFDAELQARVALKTVKSTACDNPASVRRLKTEVQLAHRVSHPNVCRIFDFGTHESERDRAVIHYLTMEFVDGRNLGELLRSEGALTIEQAVAIGRELLLGLGAAHAAGVLHRDFKSDNVMLRRRPDGSLGAVILDFGLARALDADLHSHATARGRALLGTLKYMAPEQIEGKALSTRTDLYAFGMVLFEMLTGDVAFPSATQPANALFERLRRRAPEPSTRNPEISPALDAVVGRCLARDPEQRYASAAEALAALDDVVRRGAYRARGRHRRRRALGAAAIAVGVAAFASHATLLRPERVRSERTPVVAVAAARPAHVTRSEASASAPVHAPPEVERRLTVGGPEPGARQSVERPPGAARPRRASRRTPVSAPLSAADPLLELKRIPDDHDTGFAARILAQTDASPSPLETRAEVASAAKVADTHLPELSRPSAVRAARPQWENPFERRARAGLRRQ